jgi:arylsulfatase A-like enzyme
MNLVLIVSDTLRWDYLGAYGNSWIHTPNLDALARESAVFLEAFAEGLPTIPARRVIWTGRPIFPFAYRPQAGDGVQLHGWHPLFDEDVTLGEHLQKHNYVCALVNDVYHMMKPGKNFHRGFDQWFWIRGQEGDPYALPDRSLVEEDLARAMGRRKVADRAWVIRHLILRRRWRSDADTSVAQVMRRAADWVKEYTMPNPFYLHVECFDPHEPWDPPLEYARRYDPAFEELEGMMPPGRVGEMTPKQFKDARTAYAGEVTLVDRWAGHLLDTLRQAGRMKDTLIVFTSDHGCMMGEREEVHKGQDRLRNQCTQLPLIIRHPAGEAAGARISGFCQHQDIMPTALALMDLPAPERCLGRNLWPQAHGQDGAPEAVVSAFGRFASYRTKKWNYVCPWTKVPQTNARWELYDLERDPQELENVFEQHRDAAAQLAARLEAHIKKWAPRTQGSFQSPGEGQEFSFDALPRFD